MWYTLDTRLIEKVYNTRGDELLKVVRCEVMEGLETRGLVEKTSVETYDKLVYNVMERTRMAIKAIVDNVL